MHGCILLKIQRGITFIDIMIVVTIISIVSLLAIPSFSPSEKYRLNIASQEIIFAIRFARTEAIRTGQIYAVDVDITTKQVTVYKADLNVNPVGQEFVAYHPINKNRYDYNFNSDLNLSNIIFENSSDPFLFADSVKRKTLLFDNKGIPFWMDVSTGKSAQLLAASIDLSIGDYNQSILVHPYSGRVTVQ